MNGSEPREYGTILDNMIKIDRPPKKRQPRGLPILHEDKDIIVVVKPAGLLTVGTDREKSRTAIGSKRLALHARSISFIHPLTHKLMTFDTGI